MLFSYLLSSMLFLPIWLYLYYKRKDLRDEILTSSLFIGFLGLFLGYFIWTIDWWLPQTITFTKVGIEDFILGFTIGGICVSLYEEIFKLKLVKLRKKEQINSKKYFYLVFGLSTSIGLFSFYILNIHSFYASILSMIIPSFLIYYLRKDLIKLSLWTGLLITIISIPIYSLLFYFDPNSLGWWFEDKISMLLILGIPIEDIIWFFGVGMIISPLYELYKGFKLEKMQN